ncbi:hypothetical protein Tco_1250385 [Tanacetum coccineum]
MATKPKLDAEFSGKLVDQTDYRSKIMSLMYLTSSRPDIVQAVCYCARYQARPTEKHLKEVKRIFRYLRGTINMGLWYLKDSSFELTAFSNADHAGCIDTRKSTSGGLQFLGDKLVSWMSKKQDRTAMSSAEAEYVVLSASSLPYKAHPYSINGIIELYFVRAEYQLADMFTKALPEDRFQYLVRRIGDNISQLDVKEQDIALQCIIRGLGELRALSYKDCAQVNVDEDTSKGLWLQLQQNNRVMRFLVSQSNIMQTLATTPTKHIHTPYSFYSRNIF